MQRRLLQLNLQHGHCGVTVSTPDRQSGGEGSSPGQCTKFFSVMPSSAVHRSSWSHTEIEEIFTMHWSFMLWYFIPICRYHICTQSPAFPLTRVYKMSIKNPYFFISFGHSGFIFLYNVCYLTVNDLYSGYIVQNNLKLDPPIFFYTQGNSIPCCLWAVLDNYLSLGCVR